MNGSQSITLHAGPLPLLPAEDQKWLDEDFAPQCRGIWLERAPGQSILEFLKEPGRIIDIIGMTSDHREIVIQEACDEAFAATFNKSQFSELIKALQAIHDQMRH